MSHRNRIIEGSSTLCLDSPPDNIGGIGVGVLVLGGHYQLEVIEASFVDIVYLDVIEEWIRHGCNC